MDFFKSVFANDPDTENPPPQGRTPSESPHKPEEDDDQGGGGGEKEEEEAEDDRNAKTNTSSDGGGGGAWSFGDLIKTFATKSESVIQTYRRDLEEFGSGLKKETSVIKEVATRAVRELPVSLEVGASVAQESLETVGQAIDEFGGSVWRGTTEIITHGKEALLSMDSETNTTDPYSSDPGMLNPSGSSKRYSRFETQVLAIQSDPITFSEEPEDSEDFQKWKSGFQLAEKEDEIENLLYENGVLEDLFEKLVPGVVDRDTFWARYFYKVYKIKQAEDTRANLVKRVISREEEEDLSWDVDDEDEEEEKREVKEEETNKEINVEEVKRENKEEEETTKQQIVKVVETIEEKKPIEVSQVEDSEVAFPPPVEQAEAEPNSDDSISKTENQMIPEAKCEPGESCKDSDISVVSSQPSTQEEDDLGWDEIEDLGEHDDKKVGGSGGSPKKADLHKRLSAAEEDEDLSWDIEDDDEPIKP